MDLFDLVEMFCDWKAASERNPKDGIRIDHNARIYSIAPQLAQILAGEFSGPLQHGDEVRQVVAGAAAGT